MRQASGWRRADPRPLGLAREQLRRACQPTFDLAGTGHPALATRSRPPPHRAPGRCGSEASNCPPTGPGPTEAQRHRSGGAGKTSLPESNASGRSRSAHGPGLRGGKPALLHHRLGLPHQQPHVLQLRPYGVCRLPGGGCQAVGFLRGNARTCSGSAPAATSGSAAVLRCS